MNIIMAISYYWKFNKKRKSSRLSFTQCQIKVDAHKLIFINFGHVENAKWNKTD